MLEGGREGGRGEGEMEVKGREGGKREGGREVRGRKGWWAGNMLFTIIPCRESSTLVALCYRSSSRLTFW